MATRHSQLQRELRQSKPFVSKSAEAAVSILRTADTLRRFFTAVLQQYDLTLAQFNVLRILRGAGPAGAPTLDVAARLIEATPGITLMMDRLVRKGWVRRLRARADRRQVLCFLTPAGAELLRKVDRPVDLADIRAMAALSPRQQSTLVRLLDLVRHDLADAPSPARKERS
jgi:DNA-binding MarR family transcriptional regulator